MDESEVLDMEVEVVEVEKGLLPFLQRRNVFPQALEAGWSRGRGEFEGPLVPCHSPSLGLCHLHYCAATTHTPSSFAICGLSCYFLAAFLCFCHFLRSSASSFLSS